MTIKEILEMEGISEETALREQVLLIALAKISHYQAECSNFQAKYRMSFIEMKKKMKVQKNAEDFLQEDDFLDWEYADNALNWWKQNVKEVRNAV